MAEQTADPVPTQVSLTKSILDVSGDLTVLSKDEKNEFASYNYVPIDKYYEKVASAAHAKGITWRIKEESFSRIGETKKGEMIFAFNYSFTMMFADGHEIADYSRFTILHAMTGPQTSGSAASYAEKLFMRTAFKVVTGEKDGDAEAPFEVEVRPKAEPPKGEPQKSKSATEVRDKPKVQEVHDWGVVFEVFTKAMVMQKGRDDLRKYWKDNLPLIDEMKDRAPDYYEKLVEAFTKAANKFADEG